MFAHFGGTVNSCVKDDVSSLPPSFDDSKYYIYLQVGEGKVDSV